MTKVKPILTEKGLALAKVGKYSFWVDRLLAKPQIKALLAGLYKVHVVRIKTMRYKGGFKKNSRGVKIRIPERKKTIITLKKDEKIDAFEAKKEKTKKGKK